MVLRTMQAPKNTSQPIEQSVPARIVIGVTGHRKLSNENALVEQVKQILDSKIKQLLPPMSRTPIAFTILSPLAEGADRLIARKVLEFPGSRLEVVLPMDKDEYLKDFGTEESKKEFEELLSKARRIKTLPPTVSRNEAYQRVGQYVVDNCDILIALWNGKPPAGQGGTAEIVKYAQDNGCPFFWINTEDPQQVTMEKGKGLNQKAYLDLDKYNSESVGSTTNIVEEYEKLDKALRGKAKSLTDRVRMVCEQVLPHYVRADHLAMYYQRLHLLAGSMVYALAAAAVVIVAFQALFFPLKPYIISGEVLLVTIILGIIFGSRRLRWLDKWIDYRFLAERFRSAVFLAVSGIDMGSLKPPRYLSLAFSQTEWIVVAFFSIWRQIPPLPNLDPSSAKDLRNFLCERWIDGQIKYHEKKTKHCHKVHSFMEYAGYALFGLTFLSAIIHAIHIARIPLLNDTLAFIGIIFPAVAGALGAIHTHREYLKTARRSDEMARHLNEIKEKMCQAEDLKDLLLVVREAEETMFYENLDWRVMIRFHIPEPMV